jgi:hypothetical protein
MSYTKHITWHAAMPNAYKGSRPETASLSQSPPHDPAALTVASLGMRVQLAPAKVEQEHQLRDLLIRLECS